MKSQNILLLQWLKRKPITSMIAFLDLGIVSLPRRINDLIAKGYIIDRSTWITVENRFGKKVPVKKYSYIGQKKFN